MRYHPIHFIRCLILGLAGYAIYISLAPVTVFAEEAASQVSATPKNLFWFYLKRGHTNSKSSSRLYMKISDEEMLQMEARKCCGYALMRNSKIWCRAAQ